MKRAVLALFALSILAAVPLAGWGQTQMAGGVLVGGGGLSAVLLVSLAFVGGRAPAASARESASDERPSLTGTVVERPRAEAATATKPKSAEVKRSQRPAAEPAVTEKKPAKPAEPAVAAAKPSVEKPTNAAKPTASSGKPAGQPGGPQSAKKSGKAAKRAAKRAAQAARAASNAAATPAAATPAAAKPKVPVVEIVDATGAATRAEAEEVAARFVQAAVKEAHPTDDFAADELAFFAEGETLASRPSDSGTNWHLS